jgi:hypothetical protein
VAVTLTLGHAVPRPRWGVERYDVERYCVDGVLGAASWMLRARRSEDAVSRTPLTQYRSTPYRQRVTANAVRRDDEPRNGARPSASASPRQRLSAAIE